MSSPRVTRSRRKRARAVPALLLLLLLACGAATAGAFTGRLERDMAEERPWDDAVTAAPVNRLQASEPPGRAAGSGSDQPRIEWRHSRPIGVPEAGTLERGVKLRFGGRNYFTWDPIQKESPNRGWRRWGTDRLLRTTLRVVREFAAAHPPAPRIGIGDLSRPHGGDFGPQYGLPGHSTHQNGLDVDLYYPRLDRRERPPLSPDQIDSPLAQDLVNRFVRAGAETVIVGPNTGLKGPPGVVVPLVNHDNHVHVRLPG